MKSRAASTRVQLLMLACLAGCDVSVAQEDELGDQYAEAIQRQVAVLQDSTVTSWLSALGFRLTSVADRENRDWHFYLVDDSTVNAFAIPGGHVFVHRGLIEKAETFSELAGVLGHEVAHVTLRHSVDQMQSRTKTGIVVTVLCAVINICNSTAAQVAIDVGGQALLAKYSRDDEAQADSAAVGYLVAAGINPRGIPKCSNAWLRRGKRIRARSKRGSAAIRLKQHAWLAPTRSYRHSVHRGSIVCHWMTVRMPSSGEPLLRWGQAGRHMSHGRCCQYWPLRGISGTLLSGGRHLQRDKGFCRVNPHVIDASVLLRFWRPRTRSQFIRRRNARS